MKRFLALCLAVCMLFSLFGCQAAKKKERFTAYYFEYFDTVSTIIGYAENKAAFDETCVEIEALLKEYHRLYTIYNRYEGVNNLTVVNAKTNGEHSVVQVDPKIMDLLVFAKEMYETTDGMVNVAMGSVLEIWHDYRSAGMDDPSAAELPPMEALKAAAEHTDLNRMILDEENSTVYLEDPDMSLDVGAIAKGFAVEQIAQALRQKGVTGYLLNVGGNVCAVGSAGKKPWNVGIENPDTEDEETPHIEFLHMADQSLVTSGTYQRYYYVDGEKYHHIIDPETLMPGEGYRSVSVLSDHSGVGDAFSTALFLMDYEDGLALVEATENVEAMWVMEDGEQRYSSGFKNHTYVPQS